MRSYLTLLLCSVSFISFAQDWEFQKEVEGIKAYNRLVKNSKFKEYKIEAEIESSLESMITVLQDIDIYLDVFPDNKKATVIKTNNNDHFEIFLHTKTPFPVKDRYTYSQTDYSYDQAANTVHMVIECLDNEYLTKHNQGVPVTDCKGTWEIKDLGNGTLSVKHQFYANPGGMVPAWIVNNRTIESPIKSIKSIRKFVKQPAYQNRTVEFIKR